MLSIKVAIKKPFSLIYQYVLTEKKFSWEAVDSPESKDEQIMTLYYHEENELYLLGQILGKLMQVMKDILNIKIDSYEAQ